MLATSSVSARLGFATRASLERARAAGPREVDLRKTGSFANGLEYESVACEIRDARAEAASLGLERSGFEVFRRPSAVRDWFDEAEVMSTYYEECRALAREVSGASHAFTFDHLIREPGRQTAGGGLPVAGAQRVTGPEAGGGYVGGVHMDYVEGETWGAYLALHGVPEPRGARRVLVYNFWRPLFAPADTHPLAVCDARSVRAEDLLATRILGYGHPGYSWHDIGITIYDVAASPAQRWYFTPRMWPDEVLLMKTFDSEGVIGRACPHGSFVNPAALPGAPPRRSIELRVLCYVAAS
jgi:hypothetical protein